MKRIPISVLPLLATAVLAITTAFLPAQTEGEKLIANVDAVDALVADKEVILGVEIHRLPAFHLSLSPAVATPPELSERFYFQTQALIMESSSVLERVIDRLDLADRFKEPSRQKLLQGLGRQVSASRLDNSTIIAVRVKAGTVDQARELAEAVAQCYRELCLHEYHEHANRQLRALETEIRQQEDIVAEKRKLYHTICKAVGVGAVEGGSIRDAIEARMKERRAEEGRAGEIDMVLQSEDILLAADDYQSASNLFKVMKQQHSKARMALQIPLDPITIRGTW